MKTSIKWAMPKWMRKYEPLIHNTGGNDVTAMMNGNATPDVNLPLSTLQACVKSQVSLLFTLREKGLIEAAPTYYHQNCKTCTCKDTSREIQPNDSV